MSNNEDILIKKILILFDRITKNCNDYSNAKANWDKFNKYEIKHSSK